MLTCHYEYHAAEWTDLLEERVSSYSDRLLEVQSDEELWKVLRAWDTYNKDRRTRKVHDMPIFFFL